MQCPTPDQVPALGAGLIDTPATMTTPHRQLSLDRAGDQLIDFMFAPQPLKAGREATHP